MKISVVIPAYNAQPTIGEAVAQSLAQAKGNLEVEVIVVDDGSTDSTSGVATSAGATVIRQRNAGPASARNQGWQYATGKLVCFTDADCIPSAGWVMNLIDGFEDSTVGAVGGSYDIVNERSWLARWVHREIVERHSLMPEFIRAFGAYNVAIPKYVLQATGGFDSAFRRASGEDNDLSYRILKSGWRIAFRPMARVGHHHPERLRRYLVEQYRHGFWRAKLYMDHPEMTGGDDYTRLRDRLEPVLVFGMVGLSSFASLGFRKLFLPLFGVVALYSALQLAWPLRWCLKDGNIEALPYAGVLFLRGFVRTIGLALGVFRFGLKNILQRAQHS